MYHMEDKLSFGGVAAAGSALRTWFRIGTPLGALDSEPQEIIV